MAEADVVIFRSLPPPPPGSDRRGSWRRRRHLQNRIQFGAVHALDVGAGGAGAAVEGVRVRRAVAGPAVSRIL